MMSQGMILIVHAKKPGFFQGAIMFFTDKWSCHAALTGQAFQTDSILEAGLSVQTVPFSRYQDNPDIAYELYELNHSIFSQAEIDAMVVTLYKALAGRTYGWKQIPWFVWRWLNQKIGRDIHKETNWFTEDDVICSGEIFDGWIDIGMGQVIPNVMSEYHPQTVAPSDLRAIMKGNRNVFTLVGQKD